MLSRTNTCNEYLDTSDSSDFMYNINNTINNSNTEEISRSILSDEDLKENLLKKTGNNNLSIKINYYIYSLLCLIYIILAISVTLFAIYKLTNGKRYLYNYSVIGFFIIICLFCCLCSCVKFKIQLYYH
jgi:hypothetical protein